jgi:hypothetical protein
LLLALTVAICAAALVPALASAAPTGSIEGTVTGADTHEGIENVEVCAYGFETEGEEEFFFECVFTGLDGTYAIEEVPAGEYEVEFWAAGTGYMSEYYPEFVTVGTGPVTGVDAELSRASVIEGTVTRSSDEEPVEEVEVCAWGLEEEEFGGCAETASDGTYELEVPPGEWGVEFWPGFTGQNLTYQYFDHRDRWSEADPVLVGEGVTVEEIDAALDPGATISGHVTSAATGGGLEEILVCSIDATTDELTVCTWTFEGEYEIPFLPAGQDKVVFSLDRNEWFGVEFFEDADGFPTQFWNNQTTLAAANTIPLGVGQGVSGIDARLGTPSSGGGQSVSTPPVTLPSPITIAPKPKKHCRKGFKRKKVKGKYRCVKRKHHRRHHHRSSARVSSVPDGSLSLRPDSGSVARPLVRVAR